MKLISFFSRFTFICNICFLLFVIFSKLETHKAVAGAPGTVESLPFFKDLVIILGVSAIIINLLMCISYLIVWLLRKVIVLPRWLSIMNVVFLIVEFYYFFLYK
jgi:hypothetical protein